MGLLDFLEERPLEPDDVDRARAAVDAAMGSGGVLVQAVWRPGDRYVGCLRVIDLQTQSDGRGERAERIRQVLRTAGYDAHVKGSARASWPDVEATRLLAAEWRRRQAAAG